MFALTNKNKMDPDAKILNQHKNHFVRINDELERVLSSRVALIEDIGNHALLGHGKRLRPLLFVLSSHLCNCRSDNVYLLSTIFEYIHTASLLHDDVLDNAHIRRKKPSVNQVWGNHAAVLEGDFLYSKSFSIAVASGNLAFFEKLTETTTQMAEGQVLELIHTDNWDTTREAYHDIITAKTAVLISAACACGAIISDAEEEEAHSLAQFGLNMGIAFQLMDDSLDYTSSQEVFGKPVGKDLREGKITLPLIYTLSGLDEAERARIERRFKKGKATEDDYQSVITLVRTKGALERIRTEAQAYVDEAAKWLGCFPDSIGKTKLLELNQYIVERQS